jgi:hypothetical protein
MEDITKAMLNSALRAVAYVYRVRHAASSGVEVRGLAARGWNFVGAEQAVRFPG